MSKFIKIGENRIAVDSIAVYYTKDGGTRIDFNIAGNQSKHPTRIDTVRVFRSSIFIRGLDVKELDEAIEKLSLHESIVIWEIKLPESAKIEDASDSASDEA